KRLLIPQVEFSLIDLLSSWARDERMVSRTSPLASSVFIASFSTYFLTVSKSCPVIRDIFLKLLPSNFFMFLIRYICSIVSILSLPPSSMDNLKGIIFQGCPQWSFQFMQGFLSSGTLGFYCTKNIPSHLSGPGWASCAWKTG